VRSVFTQALRLLAGVKPLRALKLAQSVHG